MKKILLTGIICTSSLLSANFSDSKKILLNKIYVDNQNTFYCNNPYEIKGVGLKKFGTIIKNEKFYSPKKIDNKRSKYIEWEHVVPAYNFGRQMPCWKEGGRKACQKDSKFNLMEADMHNLVPAIGEINEERSNYKFGFNIPKSGQFGNCNFEIDYKYKRAYPKEDIRGDIARIYFYMSDKYNLELSEQEKKMFLIWNKQDPVSKWEKIKNDRVEMYQGNRNKYIDIY